MRWTVRSSNRSMFGGSIAYTRSDERALEAVVAEGDPGRTMYESVSFIYRTAVARASEAASRPRSTREGRGERSESANREAGEV
jgi:hypothetical protein